MRALTLLVCTLAAGCTALGSDARPGHLIWRLEQSRSIGGHAPEVLGAPVPKTVDGRKALCFDGQDDGLLFDTNPIEGWPQFTVEVLLKPDGDGPEEQRFLHIEDEQQHRLLIETRVTKDKSWALDTFLHTSQEHRLTLLDKTKLQPTDTWYWAALVYDGKSMGQYVNGVKLLEGPVDFLPMTRGKISLGVRQNRVHWFKGCIAEVRFTANAKQRLQRIDAPSSAAVAPSRNRVNSSLPTP